MTRHVTDEAHDPRSRFGLYRLCDCTRCGGRGKLWMSDETKADHVVVPLEPATLTRCPDCRGEGRIRQEVASCETPEAVGVALVTLAREGEWEECPFGLLDRMPECETCEGAGYLYEYENRRADKRVACSDCKGSGVKPTGTWLVLPWAASPRNVSDAGKLLRSSQSK